MQLYLETCTLFFEIYALLRTVWEYKKENRIKSNTLIRLLGNSIGAGIMFVLPSVIGKAEGNIGYREMPANIGAGMKMIYNNGALIGRYLIGCFGIWLMWAIFIGMCSYRNKENFSLLQRILGALSGILSGLSLIHLVALEEIITPGLTKIYFIIFLLIISFIGILGWFTFINEERKTWFWLLGALVSIIPMLAVSPISPRVCYLTWFCILISVISFMEYYISETSIGYILALVLAMSLSLIIIGTEWKYCDELRMKYFERKIKEEPHITIIDLPKMPNERLLQADADSVYWRYVIRDYWGMEAEAPVDIVINWHSWYNWLNVKDN